MNLANKLTMIRIFLVPVFLVFITVKDIPYGSIIATVIFIIASLTDQLDGYIARSRNQITNFGKFMDPLADKLLVTAALVSLVELKLVPGWAVVVILAREFAVSGLRTLAASDGIVIAASWWGKIKTVTQMIAIIILLLKVNINTSANAISFVNNNSFLSGFFTYVPETIMFIAVLITIISGIDYFVKNRHVISMK
ncbi:MULTISPECIES: CDP-diacylglycerol--glycerol-3-phosphate 3-phosphatidyltransferase [unclassified Clostridium]|uniref:CDP-diacylglycerol--glycerol-3-phosphate 3-phosphatidyltransferase n=1 Tax=unclassified Clostridium TaxID=2614128 RepID=UPI0018981DEA|nr:MULTISPECIES: CDP-diacylglycerol--glycerol-3-phosphate 3-phosphatidyltransferase [unclassified Clostridium]MBP3916787.1 CDP-diacylglycerol--glycerol-3-phosphate 3-phosphatidyltransferase [Clostridium sp.]MEE0933208.1 CDP-diacylglycerol--glycerol-3-phosphate 3-phosphatidyltransferase [Clostridium sp.]